MNQVPYNQDENDAQLDLNTSSLSGYARIGLTLGVMITGFLLISFGRGFPPLVWRLFILMLAGHKSLPLNNALIILQSILLLVAWLLLLLVVIRIIRPQKPATLTINGQEQVENLEQDGLYSLLTASTPLDIREAEEQGASPSSERFWQYQSERTNQQSDENRLTAEVESTPVTFNPLLTINPFEQSLEASHEPSTNLFSAHNPFKEALQQDEEVSKTPSLAQVALAQRSPDLHIRQREDAGSASSKLFSGGKDEEVKNARITPSPLSYQGADKQPEVQHMPIGDTLKNTPTWLGIQETIAPSQEPVNNKQAQEVSFPQLLTLTTDCSRGPAQVVMQRSRFMEFLSHARRKWLDWVGWSICCSGHLSRPGKQEQVSDYLVLATGIRTGPELMPFTLAVLANSSSLSSEEQTMGYLVARTISEALLSILWRGDTLDQKTARRLLIKGMQYANGTLHRENQKHETARTATAMVLLILNNIAYIANIGNNQTYHFRRSEGLIQLTSTHSSTDISQEGKEGTARKAFEQPEADHAIFCLGQQPKIQVDTTSIVLNANDFLIFCSQGLQELTYKDSFRQLVERALTPATALPSLLCSTLVQEAQIESAGDDTSVLVLQMKARVP